MARRYDSNVTTFSPEGRLHQVEYAIESINNAGTCVGIQTAEGIVMAAEKGVNTKLLAPAKTSEKIYRLDDHISCVVAGLSADANLLIDEIRLASQRYQYTYGEPMPVEQLVQRICNFKQQYTQHGGLRPFGVSFLFAGWDKHHGFQLYQSDPSGKYSGWKATCIGSNNQSGTSILKSDYSDDLTVSQAVKLAVKVMNKTMDITNPTAEKMEFYTLTREGGKMVHRILPDSEAEKIIKEVQKELSSDSKEEKS